jgi:Tfp pilus assembly protein PilF
MSELRAKYQQAFEAFTRRDYAAAISGYQAVIEADPSFALAYQGLAEAYARLDRLDDAIETIQKAIALEPGESLFQTSLSRFLQRQGRIAEAEAAAAQASNLQRR